MKDTWEAPDASKCPAVVKLAIDRWVAEGTPCGHFVTACLQNDLIEAFARADQRNMDALRHVLAYLWNEVPSGCWGSRERVQRWADKKAALKGNALENTKGQT